MNNNNKEPLILNYSEDIIEALNQYYYMVGDANTYINCLNYIYKNVPDENIAYEIKSTFDYMEYECDIFSNNNFSSEIVDALDEYFNAQSDKQELCNCISELNTYCNSYFFDVKLDLLNLCPNDYTKLIWVCDEDYNPYEGEYFCPKCEETF